MANNDISNFVKITSSGVDVKTYSEIRTAIINRYKSVFGDDIDLSSGTADGVFIEDVSLIIKNIVDVVKKLYSYMDINNASGSFLDSLCALSNITRKNATHSVVSLQIKNVGSSAITFSDNDPLKFQDNAGTIWACQEGFTLNPYSTIADILSVNAVCETAGAISAPSGFITIAVEHPEIEVIQNNPAIIGTEQETDAELRYRQANGASPYGVALAESLVSALENIDGIQDINVYSNNTASSVTLNDNAVVAPHNVYVVTRESGINIPDKTIAETIRNKMTTGISTQSVASVNPLLGGTAKTYTIVPKILGTTYSDASMDVCWKKATPIHNEIKTTFTAPYALTTDVITQALKNIVDRLNSLSLNTQLTSSLVLSIMQGYLPAGSAITTTFINLTQLNPHTYFNYSVDQSSISVNSGLSYYIDIKG